jgi:hypothetical protein
MTFSRDIGMKPSDADSIVIFRAPETYISATGRASLLVFPPRISHGLQLLPECPRMGNITGTYKHSLFNDVLNLSAVSIPSTPSPDLPTAVVM